MKEHWSSAEVKAWNAKYKSFLDSINIGFMLFDPDYTCYDVNDAFLDMVGARREEYQRISMKSLFSEEEYQTLFDLVEPLELELKENKSVAEKKYYMFEWFWYHHQTGEKIPMLCTGAVNMNDQGVHETTYITCTDLREHKRMQREIIRENNKLEAILSGIGDCVTIFDTKGNLIFGNPQGQEIRGKRIESFMELKAGKGADIELTVSSEKRKYNGKIEGLRDSEGQIFAYAEILKDVTDQVKLEQKEEELSQMKREMQRMALQSEMIGHSHAMRNIFDLILRCARVDSTVLVLGETGTGKEMVARAVHNQSERKEKPFIAVNCGALPEPLLESELFGHVKGAFTGAVSEHKGLFREADGGTLFLDEVGDLSPTLQVKLLRVLQERQIRPVGGSKTFTVDVRVIAATHQDLNQMVKQNTYRRDLYYRLAVIPVHIPPLRDRKDDILPLAEHFINKHLKKSHRKIKTIDHSTQRILLNYDWPGNIRELENSIEHALAMSRRKTIAPSDLPVQVVHPQEQDQHAPHGYISQDSISESGTAGGLYEIPTNQPRQGSLKPWQIEEKVKIEEALLENKGNRTRTAKDLGISRGTLWRKIGLYQIDI